MSLDSLNDLYVEELKDLYSAENQIIKALPKMIKAATNPELQQAFADHLEQTKGHVARLVQICEDLGVSPKGKKCSGMEGILEEGSEKMEEDADPSVLDAGLAAAAQHVEHYEIAGYGSVRTWAQQLGYGEHVTLLQQTLDEEKTADELLSRLAITELNIEAEAEGDAADENEEEAAAPARSSKARSAAKSGRSRSRAKA
ncbi:MAG: ferritin-like protein [Gemmatimonadetes bacterium]|nr:ferritin-like protein [Gemmatimonadota bacterium]